jgi:hypothetical protein
MPGTLHQGFVWIFRDDPSLAFDLVRMVFAVQVYWALLAELLKLASRVVCEFPDDRRWRYASAILAATPDAERSELMGAMTMQEHYITQTEPRSILFNDGRREGKLEGLAELVLTLFEARSIPVDEATFDRICACDDPQVLMRWAVRAMTAASPDELFL